MERMMQLLYGSATKTDQASSSSASGFATSIAAAAAAAAVAAAAESEATGDLGGRRAAAARQSLAAPASISGRDLESHRLIEKRRRDRMNAALTELCCLIPAARAKQSLGRIEKAEIIEMAIQHIIALTSLLGKCKLETVGHQIPALCAENFQLGFLDCTRATLGYLAETEGPLINTDGICTHLYANLRCAMQRFTTASSDEDPEISSLLDTRGLHQAMPTQQPVGSSSSEQQCSQTPLLAEAATSDANNAPTQAFLSSAAAAAAAASAVATAGTNISKEKPATPSPQQKRICDNADESEEGGCGDGRESACSSSHSVSGASSTGDGDSNSDPPHLPGFVLHPSGTHYLPLVLPRLALSGETLRNLQDDEDDDDNDDEESGAGERPARAYRRLASSHRQEVLHPISIPVSFRSARLLRVPPTATAERSAKTPAAPTAVKRKRSADDC